MWDVSQYFSRTEGAWSNHSTPDHAVFDRVFRRNFAAPGFALVDFGPKFESRDLRAAMVQLKGELQQLCRDAWQRELIYLSMGRFDQQVTTKPHIDGAPPESVLSSWRIEARFVSVSGPSRAGTSPLSGANSSWREQSSACSRRWLGIA
jgi:hypothetical protein